MNDQDKKEKQRKVYNKDFFRQEKENVLANRFPVVILSPSVESTMAFYIYLN